MLNRYQVIAAATARCHLCTAVGVPFPKKNESSYHLAHRVDGIGVPPCQLHGVKVLNLENNRMMVKEALARQTTFVVAALHPQCHAIDMYFFVHQRTIGFRGRPGHLGMAGCCDAGTLLGGAGAMFTRRQRICWLFGHTGGPL